MILHHMNCSPFGDKIIRMLKYKGLDFKLQVHPLADRSIKKSNGTGKLPYLEFQGKTVSDSTDIAHFIDEQFPEKPLIPKDPTLKAQVHIFEDWADESLYFYEMHMRFTFAENSRPVIKEMTRYNGVFGRWFLGKVMPLGIKSITQNQGVGKKSTEQIVKDIERHIRSVNQLLEQSTWLVGDTISLADISVATMFNCLKDTNQCKAIFTQNPNVEEWMSAVDKLTL